MTPEEHVRAALEALGLSGDPETEGTAARWTEFLREFAPGPLPQLEAVATESRDLVVLRDLPFHSLCAHHLLPFFGTATIAVRPAGRIAGLGSLARLVLAVARRPQLQERLAAEAADAVMSGLGARTAGIRLVGRHFCLEMRGARVPATFEVTALRGEEDAELRASLS